MNEAPAPRGPGPHIGVSVAVWRGDSVLLVRRGRGAATGLWAFPGGLVELGEWLEAAVARELFEETEVIAAIEERLDVAEIINSGADGAVRHHYVLVVYRARHLAGEPKAGDDAAEARWFKRDEWEAIEMTPDTARLLADAGAGD